MGDVTPIVLGQEEGTVVEKTGHPARVTVIDPDTGKWATSADGVDAKSSLLRAH